MFLAKNYSKKTGRTYLQIVHSYRDKEGKTKRKVEKSLGYLDVLEKEYDDPIAHFEQIAKQMEQKRLEEKDVYIRLNADDRVDRNSQNRKNFGHVVFNKIYHELELDRFFNNKRRHENFKFNTNSIIKVLIFARLIYPCSKRTTVKIKDLFFDKADFTLDDVYHSLKHFNKVEKDAQQFIHERIVKQYGRKTDLLYYDVTNYYFEIDKQDNLRKRGPSKEHRPNPIVQMGLALDRQGIPLSYQLFEGNTHDSQTMMPVLKTIKKQFKTDCIIVVADKGLNSGDNIAFNSALGDGYLYSQTIRGASNEFKQFVLDNEGYRGNKDFKIKSRVIPTTINVTVGKYKNGKPKKKKIQIDQKQVVYCSSKFAKRSKNKREELLAKATDLISNPSKYTKATSYGAASYVTNIEFDKETGEIQKTGKRDYQENQITIIYDTMWNGTKHMADAIASGIRQVDPDVTVKLMHTGITDKNDVLTEVFKSKAILVGSPTINGSVLSSIVGILDQIKGLGFKNKKGAAFGAYGWSGEGVKLINEHLTNSSIELVNDGLRVLWNPDQEAVEKCVDLGKEFAKSL